MLVDEIQPAVHLLPTQQPALGDADGVEIADQAVTIPAEPADVLVTINDVRRGIEHEGFGPFQSHQVHSMGPGNCPAALLIHRKGLASR